MSLKINRNQDRFEAYPGGTYEGVIERFWAEPSRFVMRDDDGNDILGDDGEPVRAIVPKVKVTAVYHDDKGNERNLTYTEEFGKGVVPMMRNLTPDSGFDANGKSWIDQLPGDSEDEVEFPTTDEGDLLVNGELMNGAEVSFDIKRTSKGDAVYNRLSKLKLR